MKGSILPWVMVVALFLAVAVVFLLFLFENGSTPSSIAPPEARRSTTGQETEPQAEVEASPEGEVKARERVIPVGEPREKTPPAPPTPRGLEVQGRVKEKGGGALPGATVRVRLLFPEIQWKGNWVEGKAGPGGRFDLVLSVDPAALPPMKPDPGRARVVGWAEAPVHHGTEARSELFSCGEARPENVSMDFELPPGAVVRGRVVDGQGSPSGDARVYLFPGEGEDPGGDEAKAVVRSREDGGYEIPIEEAGAFQLRARHPALGISASVPVVLDPGRDTLPPDLVLAGPGVLSGRVVYPDGRPLDRVRLRLYALPKAWAGLSEKDLHDRMNRSDREWIPAGLTYGRVMTGPGGRFRLAGLKKGDYFLVPRREEPYARDPFRLEGRTYTTGTEGIDLEVSIYTIFFRVLDFEGRFVSGANCMVKEYEGEKLRKNILTRSRRAGRDTCIAAVMGRIYTLEASRNDRIAQRERLEILPGVYEYNVDLVLGPLTSRRGTLQIAVLGPDEKPLPDFQCRVHGIDGGGWSKSLSSEDGTPCLVELPAGAYRVELLSSPLDDFPLTPASQVVQVDPGREGTVTFHVRREARLRIRVHLPDGMDQVMPRTFELRPSIGGPAKHLTYMSKDEKGMIYYQGPLLARYPAYSNVLDPGAYDLHFEAEGFLPVDRAVEVLPGRDTEVVLELKPSGS